MSFARGGCDELDVDRADSIIDFLAGGGGKLVSAELKDLSFFSLRNIRDDVDVDLLTHD